VRNRFLEIVVIIGLIAMSANAASADAYKCYVKNHKTLSDSGELVDFWGKETVGVMTKEFVVDKQTGRMSGELKNHNAFGEPQVLDLGGARQAYKVMTIYQPLTTVDFLYVQEFASGSKKPFFFTTGTMHHTGLCEHY